MIHVASACHLPGTNNRSWAELFVKLLGQGAPRLIQGIETIQLDRKKRRLEAVQPTRPPDFIVNHCVRKPLPEIAILEDPPVDPLVGGRHNSPIPDPAKIFGRIKTEGSGVSQGAGLFPVPQRTMRLASVFDHLKAMGLCDPSDRIHVRTLTEKVDRDHGPRLPGKGLLKGFWIKRERNRIHIREHRDGPEVKGCERGRRKCKRRNNHFIARFYTRRFQAENQRVGPRRNSRGVRGSDIPRVFTLKILERRTKNIGATCVNLFKRGHDLALHRLMLSLDVEVRQFRER